MYIYIYIYIYFFFWRGGVIGDMEQKMESTI